MSGCTSDSETPQRRHSLFELIQGISLCLPRLPLRLYLRLHTRQFQCQSSIPLLPQLEGFFLSSCGLSPRWQVCQTCWYAVNRRD